MASIAHRVAGTPMNSVAEAVRSSGGIEEEWFIEGTATSYRLVGGGSDYPADGFWDAEPAEEHTFRTRMIVVRPADPANFKGTVIVCWNNVSAGESFELGTVAAQLIADGFAIVGVSAQRVGVEGAGEMAAAAGYHLPSLKGDDAERYASLEHPSDDYSYDIFTQVGALVGPHRSTSPDPMAGLEVRHLIATGGSQSGARLMSYINGVHPLVSVFDAFLVTVIPNAPCSLNAATAPPTLPQMGGPNPFDLLAWKTHLYRDDLAAPVILLNSESEAASCYPNAQPDSDRVRVWEIAGTGHAGLIPHGDPGVSALAGIPKSDVSYAAAKRGALNDLHQWVGGGEPPPSQPRIVRSPDGSAIARDEHGNALGGIRWPELDAPLATHRGEPDPEGWYPFGLGNSTPFTADTVRSLYADRAAWLARYEAAVGHLIETKVIVAADAAEMLERAQAIEFPG
jgi:Alpha/beta hydrolase domain